MSRQIGLMARCPEDERTAKPGHWASGIPMPDYMREAVPALTAQERKQRPLYSGVFAYFPDALLEVAYCSWKGNEQHNPGEPLHWAKEKSTDEADALMRHLVDAGKRDSDGVRHSAKVAWRALALLQREIEAERSAGK